MPVQAPIVLVHGITGFDSLKFGPFGLLSYFNRVRETLLADGNPVPAPPRLNWAGAIDRRAEDLAAYIRATPELDGRKFHIIAHSMGGLDARRVISAMPDIGSRVLSLTTLGTPHAGTPFADWGTEKFRRLIDLICGLGLDLGGFDQLTTDYCGRFNRDNPDRGSVRYFSVAGNFRPGLLDLVLKFSHDLIAAAAGDNDGLVPAASAKRWDTLNRHDAGLDEWPGGHFRLVNWGNNLGPSWAEARDPTILQNYIRVVRVLEKVEAGSA